MREFKNRASGTGDFMTNGRAKDSIGETSKNLIKEWLISELTGKRKRITSKYLSSGIDREPLSIERVSRHYKKPLTKNDVRLENDYFTGEFDACTDDMVIDVKSSWDAFTFPYFMTEPHKGYWAQLQIYMNLTGLRKASLCYCLENGTEDMIDKLSWTIAKEEGCDEPTIAHWEQAEKELNYDHLPDHMRIKVFEFEYDEAFIKSVQERVIFAREYIKNELLPIFKK